MLFLKHCTKICCGVATFSKVVKSPEIFVNLIGSLGCFTSSYLASAKFIPSKINFNLDTIIGECFVQSEIKFSVKKI